MARSSANAQTRVERGRSKHPMAEECKPHLRQAPVLERITEESSRTSSKENGLISEVKMTVEKLRKEESRLVDLDADSCYSSDEDLEAAHLSQKDSSNHAHCEAEKYQRLVDLDEDSCYGSASRTDAEDLKTPEHHPRESHTCRGELPQRRRPVDLDQDSFDGSVPSIGKLKRPRSSHTNCKEASPRRLVDLDEDFHCETATAAAPARKNPRGSRRQAAASHGSLVDLDEDSYFEIKTVAAAEQAAAPKNSQRDLRRGEEECWSRLVDLDQDSYYENAAKAKKKAPRKNTRKSSRSRGQQQPPTQLSRVKAPMIVIRESSPPDDISELGASHAPGPCVVRGLKADDVGELGNTIEVIGGYTVNTAVDSWNNNSNAAANSDDNNSARPCSRIGCCCGCCIGGMITVTVLAVAIVVLAALGIYGSGLLQSEN